MTEVAVPTSVNHAPDFSYLSRLEITRETTAEWLIRNMPYADDGTMPVLIVAPATKENVGLYADHLHKVQRAALRATDSVTPEILDRHREDDRVLYPTYVVKGWKNVRDGSNQPIAFTVEACRAFIRRLPAWLFDKLRSFCEAPENFVSSNLDGSILGKG